MFKKLINFTTILLSISLNNSESSHLNLRQNEYDIVTENFIYTSFGDNCYKCIAETINEYAGNYLNVDSVKTTNNNNDIIFKGIRNIAPSKILYLAGCPPYFKPNITFDCGNNKVNFPEINLNNIGYFTIKSNKPITVKNLYTQNELTNNKECNEFTIDVLNQVRISCISK